jgi:hypothetical protein
MTYGSGFWLPDEEVFVFGFVNRIPSVPGLPPIAAQAGASTAMSQK